jgi:hypothetical protein
MVALGVSYLALTSLKGIHEPYDILKAHVRLPDAIGSLLIEPVTPCPKSKFGRYTPEPIH